MKKALLFFFIFLLIKPLLGQRIPDFFIQSSAYISYIKHQDTILLRNSGSGFLIFEVVDTIQKRGKVFLVTNKHVLPSSRDSRVITIKVPYKTEKGYTYQEFNVQIYNKDNSLSSIVRFHKNRNTDIAVIDITEIINLKKIHLNPIQSAYLFRNTYIKDHNKIGIGDEVFIIGYPSSIYDIRTVLPIVRQGIISSNPFGDFYFSEALIKKDSTLPNPLKGFLVDGSIFPGSSGSMVILRTSYEIDKNFTIQKEYNFVLGIVSKNINTKDQSIDLGIVISTESILEVIREF
jgi:hypothetical protein